MASFSPAGLGIVGSARKASRSSYPTQVPEDLHGAVDAGPALGGSSAMAFAGGHHAYAVPGRSPDGPVADHRLTDHRLADHHLAVGHASSLPQLLSPDMTTAHSPSMASDGVHDGVSTPPDTAVARPPVAHPPVGADAYPAPRPQAAALYPRACVSMADVSPLAVPDSLAGADAQRGLAPDGGCPLLYRGGVVGPGFVPDATAMQAGTGAYAHELPQALAAFPHGYHGYHGYHHYHHYGGPGSQAVPLSRDRLVPIPRAPPSDSGARCYRFTVAPLRSEARWDRHAQLFPCLFHAAGCNSGFPGKNEWKRHINTIHVREKTWICANGDCASMTIVSHHEPAPGDEAAFPVAGRVFNRKDLFMSHLDRAHEHLVPAEARASRRLLPASPEFEGMAQLAHHRRVRLPTAMVCSVAGCPEAFRGATAWDCFLEHVADHLKRTLELPSPPAAPPPPAAVMPAHADTPLMRWGRAAGFLLQTPAGAWRLREPVRNGKHDRKRAAVKRTYDEEADWGLRAALPGGKRVQPP